TTTQWTAWCTIENGGSDCTCQGSAFADYRITSTDFSDGCDFLGSLCKGAPPTLSGDIACEKVSETGIPAYGCQGSWDCVQPVFVDEGPARSRSEHYDRRCETLDGKASCNCVANQHDDELALVLPGSADEAQTCHIVTGACTGMLPLELKGEPDCAPSSST